MVPKAGFEPAWVAPHGPQPCVSTKFHHFGYLTAWAICKHTGFNYKTPDEFKTRPVQKIGAKQSQGFCEFAVKKH